MSYTSTRKPPQAPTAAEQHESDALTLARLLRARDNGGL
jgi:hypothetical protein